MRRRPASSSFSSAARRGLAGAVASAAALAAASAALAAAAIGPGEPCTTAGEIQSLNGGKIQCVGGTWQPYSSSAPGAAPATPPAGAPAAGPTTPGSGAAPIPTAAIFTKVGIALTPATFASSNGQVADVTAVRLADGRIRLYAFVAKEGVHSAVSTSAAGTSFTAEAGQRITFAPGGQTRAYVLADGRVRLFYTGNGAINSAISTDGLTFTDEGPRITTAAAGFEPGGISIVKFKGGYRAYFSNLEKPGVRADRITRTATSPDMLTWTVGPVITGASGTIKDGASHPFAITDGTRIALYYNGDRGSWYGVLRSVSTDGITFTTERAVLGAAGDPQLIAGTGGATLMYYGVDTGSGGFGVAVARATVNPITGGVTAATPAKKK
jgi:hypothetical protein